MRWSSLLASFVVGRRRVVYSSSAILLPCFGSPCFRVAYVDPGLVPLGKDSHYIWCAAVVPPLLLRWRSDWWAGELGGRGCCERRTPPPCMIKVVKRCAQAFHRSRCDSATMPVHVGCHVEVPWRLAGSWCAVCGGHDMAWPQVRVRATGAQARNFRHHTVGGSGRCLSLMRVGGGGGVCYGRSGGHQGCVPRQVSSGTGMCAGHPGSWAMPRCAC